MRTIDCGAVNDQGSIDDPEEPHISELAELSSTGDRDPQYFETYKKTGST
jgi:hypothetical protein